MSRLTGKESFGLMEAYQQVYAPQELTEEQVWEGVENWVQSLLEEGYDLSDYTWNEMYENYIISEQQGILDRAIDAGAEVIKKPIENFANKKVGGIPGALGIPGAVAGQQVDQTAQQLKNKDFGGAFKTVAGGVQSLMQSHDLYDTILEYLISEGYADTQEAALAIMGNMSEDWRESIILEQTLPSNYTDYKAPAVQASHARSMGDASRMRQMGMNATSVDPEDDAQSNLNDVTSGSGVAKPLSGTTIRSGAGKGFKVGDPGIIIRPNN